MIHSDKTLIEIAEEFGDTQELASVLRTLKDDEAFSQDSRYFLEESAMHMEALYSIYLETVRALRAKSAAIPEGDLRTMINSDTKVIPDATGYCIFHPVIEKGGNKVVAIGRLPLLAWAIQTDGSNEPIAVFETPSMWLLQIFGRPAAEWISDLGEHLDEGDDKLAYFQKRLDRLRSGNGLS